MPPKYSALTLSPNHRQRPHIARDSPRFSPYPTVISGSTSGVRKQAPPGGSTGNSTLPSILPVQSSSEASWFSPFDDDTASAFDQSLLTETSNLDWVANASDTPWGLLGIDCATQPTCSSSDDLSTSSETSFIPSEPQPIVPPLPEPERIVTSGSQDQQSSRSLRVRLRARALWNAPFEPFEDVSPILTLTFDSLIRPQLEIFYERIYPMMPIYTYQEIATRFNDPTSKYNVDLITMMLSMASLSLIHPLYPHEIPERHNRAKQSKLLMDEVCRLRAKWNHGCQPSIEGIMTSYCMFGALFELGQDAGARMRLKEAVSMGESMDLDTSWDTSVNGTEIQRRFKMYWILGVTESLSGTANEVFHEDVEGLQGLTEVQKADLLVTWQWLRNKLWRLASLHHMTGEDGERELSVDFVVEVASTTVEICKRLSLSSMEAHGTGFVEKLYDIASIITELLQSGEDIQPRLLAIVQTERWMDMLNSLTGFVSRHRGGGDFTGQLAIAANLITNLKMLMDPVSLFANNDGQTSCR
ncbi:hypothetical protein I317_03304 [Kwoniella heveanensis CBS 569]|nr:hypothetical protein I317_03304 [Kwoniella heveanensis CBS 569]